jgi:hypothetical protein
VAIYCSPYVRSLPWSEDTGGWGVGRQGVRVTATPPQLPSPPHLPRSELEGVARCLQTAVPIARRHAPQPLPSLPVFPRASGLGSGDVSFPPTLVAAAGRHGEVTSLVLGGWDWGSA